MILTCPECSARYVIDPKALMPNGRAVRCAKCKHTWKEDAPDKDVALVDEAENPQQEDPAPQQEGPAPQQPASDEEGAEDDFAIRRARRQKRPRPLPKGTNLPALQNHKHGDILWGWYGLGAFVAIIITSVLIFQTTISEFWPPSQKLYRTLGLKDNGGMDSSEDHQGEQNTKEPAVNIPPEDLFRIENTVPSKILNGTVVTLKVEGNITNLTDETHDLPLLRISLKDAQGQVIREWTFKPSATTISEDEKVAFVTSLPNPPDDAVSISVTFAQK